MAQAPAQNQPVKNPVPSGTGQPSIQTQSPNPAPSGAGPSLPSLPSLPSVPRFKLSPLKLPFLLALIALIAVALGIALIVFQQRQNRVVKTQDGITVTAEEVQENLDYIKKQAAFAGVSDYGNKDLAIENAINRQKLFNYAQQKGINVSEQEIDEAIDGLNTGKVMYPVPKPEELEKYGWSIDDLRAKIKIILLSTKMDDTLRTWLEYKHISIMWKNSKEAELATTLILEAEKKLKSGDSFNSVLADLQKNIGGLEIFYNDAPVRRFNATSGSQTGTLEEFIDSLPGQNSVGRYKAENKIYLFLVTDYHQGEGYELNLGFPMPW